MAGSTRTRNIYNPASTAPFKLSRSKIELFIECSRCFYLDRRLAISRPSGPPFTLNTAVDALLKKEFDAHRIRGDQHPLMSAYGIDAVPFAHEKMDEWRENFVGVQFYHAPTNFLVTGAVDDIWMNRAGELHVVDYKATSTEHEISLEDEWKAGYKRQMEVYQWLLRRNGFPVSSLGYFVFVNGKKDKKAFDGKLEFDVLLLTYKGSDAWIDEVLLKIKTTLNSQLPTYGSACKYCPYLAAVAKLETRKK